MVEVEAPRKIAVLRCAAIGLIAILVIVSSLVAGQTTEQTDTGIVKVMETSTPIIIPATTPTPSRSNHTSTPVAVIANRESHTPPPINRGNVERPKFEVALNMKATAYDLSIESCGKSRKHPAYGITASGKRAVFGRTVAVDPKTIPLGSELYIVFPAPYEHLTGDYIAEDIGSAIKGNKIDIFLGESKYKEAMSFGRRQVKVYIKKRR